MNRVFIPLLFTIFTLLLISKENFAQFIPKEKPQEVASMSRFYWESSFGLQIGGITNVEISPALGYTLVKNFSAGVGISYIFYQNNYYVPAYRTNIFGGSTYLRYQIIDRFLIQGEVQLLNYDSFDDFTGEKIRKTVPGYLLGVGYRQWFSDKMFGDIFLLWNFNDVNDYPYNNPILRITFGGFIKG